MDAKSIFKSMHRRAREFKRIHPDAAAYWLSENALSDFFDDGNYGEGIDRVIEISNAVLWAIHWRFCPPKHENLPLWASERRYWLHMSPERSEMGFEFPVLP